MIWKKLNQAVPFLNLTMQKSKEYSQQLSFALNSLYDIGLKSFYFK